MGTGHLREGDADLLVAVLEEARRDDPGPAVPWALLDGLQRLVPCDRNVSYQRHDHRNAQTLLLQVVPADGRRELCEPEPEEDDPFWRLWWSSTCSWPQRSGDLRSVVHSGDFFPSERARRADPMHAEVLPHITGDLVVSLPAPPGEARRFVFMRSCGTPFDERDRQVLDLLRPHLCEVLLDAHRRRAGVPRLSPREWEVLALTAAGLSSAEVAAALWISVGTVRKHTEHIREKLGVHSLAAAAVQALPHAPGSSLSPAGLRAASARGRSG